MNVLDAENLFTIRSYLNHINGFSDMLRVDARLAGMPEIESVFRSISQEAQEIKYTLIQAQCNSADEELQPVIREEIARHSYVILIQLVKLENAFFSESHDRFKDFIHEVRVAAYEMTRMFEDLLDIQSDSAFSMSEEESQELFVEDFGDRDFDDMAPILFASGLSTSAMHRLSLFATKERYHLQTLPPEDTFIDYIHEHDIDLILMDIETEGGMFQLSLLKKDPVLFSIPVIIISNCTDPAIIIKSIELGAVDFMPYDYTDVLLNARIKAASTQRTQNTEHSLYVKKLEKNRKLMQKELSAGASYVTNMLPPPEKSFFLSVDWRFLPSLAMGGDIFDYRWISPTQFAVYLIDVSGHGLEAALLSVTVMNVLKNSILLQADFADPASVLGALNKIFRIEEQNNMYFTAWYGVYDTTSHILTYASAGSQPAIFFPPSSPCENLSTHGLIIGLDPDIVYTNNQRFISTGSSLYIFSDGVFEIRKKNQQMMNLQEFTEILATYAPIGNDPKSFVDRVVEMSEHKKFEDDVSFIEIHFIE